MAGSYLLTGPSHSRERRERQKERGSEHSVVFSQVCVSVSVCAQLLSRVQLFFNPMDFSPPASSVLGMPQARALEWVAMPSSRRFPDPGIPPAFLPLLHRQLDSLTTEPWGKDTKTRSDQSSILRSPFNLNSFLL